MEDAQIIELYWARDEQALRETAIKFESLCRSIAARFVPTAEDAEECVNETWLRAWNSIPPKRPTALAPFLAKITRNLALDRCRESMAEKRGGGELPLALEELGEVASGSGIESELERKQLAEALNGFLRALPEKDRVLFLRRYFSVTPLRELAAERGTTERALSMRLHRLRGSLRLYLEKEGFSL